MSAKRGLGKGIAALLGGDDPADAPSMEATRRLPIEQLQPGRYQPRRHFDAEAMDQLVQSIREQGVIQPLLVRPIAESRWEIIAGERRWRAAQAAKLHEVPVVIRELSDVEALEIGLIENVQRTDLSAIEEAAGYQQLISDFQYTQDRIAQTIGKSRAHIANLLRLLTLPNSIQSMIREGRLSAGHARALVGLPDAEALAQQVVTKGLSVREAERLAQGRKGRRAEPGTPPPPTPAAAWDADIAALQQDISTLLGLQVVIDHDPKGRGRVVIHYGSLEQLDDVIARLNQR
ncbi:MAG: ParB/RepB/Spo0J family partition protein [Alphaproteobacteria bacterium]|nr:ParB/RepB/Spo0J family partition protein [Alphaproteobacteria bacterium]TAD89052.1 MAG: ParB/RepB/Spo0J family partition protein [Alphaproteobacteria bacterium]